MLQEFWTESVRFLQFIVEILYDQFESSPNPNQSNSENEEENTESE